MKRLLVSTVASLIVLSSSAFAGTRLTPAKFEEVWQRETATGNSTPSMVSTHRCDGTGCWTGWAFVESQFWTVQMMKYDDNGSPRSICLLANVANPTTRLCNTEFNYEWKKEALDGTTWNEVKPIPAN
jgi:hypothetical protein